ncbi:MAG: cyclic nucleotide-binding domain-containing protein [Actinomycetota bacterium]
MLLRRRIDTPESLAGTALATAVPAAELETVMRRGTIVDVSADAALINEDTFGREFLVILAGQVEVSRDATVVATLGAGDIVGEIALLENTRRNATVVARSDAQVLAFNRREFVTVLDECPAFAAFVIATAEARQVAAA